MTPAEKASVIREHLENEKRKAHIATEVARRDLAALVRQQQLNPESVTCERVALARSSVERAKGVETYVGQCLAGYPKDSQEAAVTR